MPKIHTFVDANVLIAAFRGNPDLSQRAMEILDDPEREFIVSDYLKLEVIPKPTFHRQEEELQFMKAYFDSASILIESSPSITLKAFDLACKYNLNAFDAMHAGTAFYANAAELITLENPTKPLYQITEVKVKSLLN